ncbi:MAG TPA: glycosyltransferase family 4 protein [Candidatus Blautia stercoripullorum]|uniref:Glycosyltransferase family 4 protein n=1 Tax=Candidatus Blautia stercoripullorum TaxID=2838502 RepID=A0A9D2U4V8_9FIRM|nr:glycosyltransferase family 4 protein [Candidatus Blautia stercoripullorum]
MKKIAVISMGVKLNGEKGYSRFRYIGDFLSDAGYQVDLITTTFQHWEKAQRDVEAINKEEYKFRLKFIYEPGYKKNIDIRRIFSHRIAAKNLKKMLEKEGDYDLIYCEIPPNDVALAAAKYAHDRGIPFVPDVNDLWPEAMRMVLDIPVVSDILFYPLKRDAEKVYSLVSGIVGTSDEYRDRPLKNQKLDVPKKTVYVGNEIAEFDKGVSQYGPEILKKGEEFWVTYAGTIGTSYDIRTMVLAGKELLDRKMDNIKIKILGNGPLKEELEKLAKDQGCRNVEFLGYVSYPEMAAWLAKSDILVNSFVKKAPQSIVTKIGDYLAAGKPMINTCMSPEFRTKVEKDGFGINILPEDPRILADAVADLYKDPEGRKRMGRKAREIAMEQFDRPQSYKKIIELIEELT